MNPPDTEPGAIKQARRPWWRWNLVTLLALMLAFLGLGYATFGGPGAFVAVWFAFPLWVLLRAFPLFALYVRGGFQLFFGRYARAAMWTVAVVATAALAFGWPYLRHFAATELIWRTGGVIQYEGGKDITNVIATQETFRRQSGETWKKRFYGPVIAVRLHPKNWPVPLWFLRSFPNLTHLSNVSVGSGDMHHLRAFPKLTNLVITARSNLDSGLAYLKELPELTGLRFNGGSAVSDVGLRTITQLPKLNGLLIESQGITDEGLKNLKSSPVKYLVLNSRNISDQGLLHLYGMELSQLVLDSAQVTNEGILALRRAIPELDTYPEPQPADATQQALVKQLEELQGRTGLDEFGHVGEVEFYAYIPLNDEPGQQSAFAMEGDRHFTNDDAQLLEQCTDLTHLGITSREFDDDGLAHLKLLAKLKTLSLTQCPIKGEGLRHLPRPSQLVELNLSQCPLEGENLRHLDGLDTLATLIMSQAQIGDDGMASIPSLPQLEALNADQCGISDAGISRMAEFPRLKSLNLFGNKTITNKAVPALSKFLQLEELNLYDTGLTKDGVKQLRAALPNCAVFVDEAADPEAQLAPGQ